MNYKLASYKTPSTLETIYKITFKLVFIAEIIDSISGDISNLV